MRPASGTGASLQHADHAAALARFAADVEYYLLQDPRQLPSRYLYDELGSALFEAICRLPWYAVTRAEGRLLEIHKRDVLQSASPTVIVELGSGSGEKLSRLLDASTGRGRSPAIHLVDVSAAALEQAARTLMMDHGVDITAHRARYEEGLHDAALSFGPADRVLVLFLGSNIGNFDPPSCDAVLRSIRAELRAGDTLLLGADLVKPRRRLQLAYDDPLGVTAAFNLNLLVRVNRELEGDFAVERFAHRAVWNADASRIEMHLVAKTAQDIHVKSAGLHCSMRAGEPIWTESSYKYHADEIGPLLERAGFRPLRQWIDTPDAFVLTLGEAV